jgi:hypothetical protein
MTVRALSRRRFTRSLGILAASVPLTPPPAFGQKAGALPFSLGNNKRLKGWVRLEQDKTEPCTGKAELGHRGTREAALLALPRPARHAGSAEQC